MIRYLFLLLSFVSVSSRYHSTDTILKRVEFLCARDPQLTCSYENDILVVDWNKHMSMNQFWVMNEHAREIITGEIGLQAVQLLTMVRPDIRITLIPILNVWGRKEVENGNNCLRKNSNGVDTNRNFQLMNNLKHYDQFSEEYEGIHPLSEKESQLVSGILQRGVRRYINIHSGEYSIYMPWDSMVVIPPNVEKMKKMVALFKKECDICNHGQAAAVSLYKAYGTSVDYAISIGVPEAYTFEVFGREVYDCHKMFNPDASKMQDIMDMWARILKISISIP